MKQNCDEEQFLKDVEDHKMEIIRDDDTTRHIRFREPGTICYGFDLITWPGHLCITGDCGTYVFSRIHDMFSFFRMDDNDFNKRPDRKLNINPGYWGEKLLSVGTNAGYKEFCEDSFKERVKNHFDTFWEGTENKEAKAECWEAIEDDVLSQLADYGEAAYSAIHSFHHDTPDDCENFYFQDFFDGGGTERYTFHYLWNLYAIAYGIVEYDKVKAAEVEAVA